MSAEAEPPLLSSVTAHLRQALHTARTVKPSVSVEPPLSAADFHEHVDSIAQAQSQGRAASSKELQQLAVETAARSILLESLATAAEDDQPSAQVWNLLDIVQFCADGGHCEGGLTLWLIEELLDSQTIDGCRTVFDYLESRCEGLVGAELTQNKRNTILRTCNELLHRLSRAEDAVFCGRVFIFLSKIFPLGDKSAVNLRGEFHTDNKTTFEASRDENGHEDASSAADAPDAEKGPVDPLDDENLYPTFWAMQHIFSNPPRLFEAGELNHLKRGIGLTLARFESAPKILTTAHGSVQGAKYGQEQSDVEASGSFNPKYLTSQDLFKLEMNDVVFQRHILVQALILLDFALSLTLESKVKAELFKPQKAMTYSYTLHPDDEKWAKETQGRISGYLRRDIDGRLYTRMVKTVLSRDKDWVKWKAESCPSISRDPVGAEAEVHAQQGVKRLCTSRRVKSRPMGGMDLSFLSKSSSIFNLDTYTVQNPPNEVALADLVQEAKEVQLDLEMIDESKDSDEWARAQDRLASKKWRALRLGAATNMGALAVVDDATGLDPLLQPPMAHSKKNDQKKQPMSESGRRDAGGTANEPSQGPQADAGAANGHTTDVEMIT